MMTNKKKAGFGQQGQQPPPTGGFGGAAAGTAAGGGFGFVSSPPAANGNKKGFGFQSSGFKTAGAGGFGAKAAAAPFGGVAAGIAPAPKVGFGFGATPQQGSGMQGSGMMTAQQQQQQQQQQHFMLTEEQKRQNKLDRILEKQGKLETLLPTPGVVDRVLPPSSLSSQQLQPQQTQSQSQYYQSRDQSQSLSSHLRGPLAGAADASRGRPLSSGITGTATSSSGRSNPLMSPEVLLGRRAKKLTIDHSQCPDMTEGMPSPYAKISRNKKELARSVDQAAISSSSSGESSSSSSRGSSSSASLSLAGSTPKKARQEMQETEHPPVRPHFDPIGTPHYERDEVEHQGPEQMEEQEEEVQEEEEQEEGESSSSSSQCPRLTREGYFTRPDLAILRAMSPPELASVPHFTMYVPNIGSIVWRGRTDVRGLDLDAVVAIEHQAVTVYPESTVKPEVGSGLNKAAEITLYNIFPKSNASQSKQLNFVNKLRMSNDSSDATFESYDRESGTWVFSTAHFSKHGLADSDSDSEGEDEGEGGGMSLALQLPPNTSAPSAAKHKGKSLNLPPAAKPPKSPAAAMGRGLGSGIIRRNTDLQSLQRIKSNVTATQATTHTMQEDSSRHSQRERERELKGKSDAYAHLLEASTNYQPRYEHSAHSSETVSGPSAGLASQQQQQQQQAHPPLRRDRFSAPAAASGQQPSHGGASTKPDVSFVEAGKYASRKLFSVEDSPCLRLLRAVKDRHTAPTPSRTSSSSSSISTSMRTVSVGRAQRPVDAALWLGRSFRVGWSVDGKLLHTGTINFNKLSPATSAASSDAPTTVSSFSAGSMSNHESSSSCHGVVRLHTIDTMLHHGSDSFDLIPRLMASLKNSSLSTTPAASPPRGQVLGQGQGQDRRRQVPLWSLPKADVNQWDEYVRFVNLLKQLLEDVQVQGAAAGGGYLSDRNHPCWILSRVVSLVDAVCGQEGQWIHRFKSTGVSDLMMPLNEQRRGGGEDDQAELLSEKEISRWERRRELISSWLKSICEDDLDQDVANIPLGDRPESVLLALLCCGRVEDAVEVAERAGLFRLSMLLCQAGGDDDVLFMLQQQVELWEDQGATSPDLLPEDMLAVYKILGGKYEETESVLSPIDWSNAIGVLFWFCNGSMGKLSDALVKFEDARHSNETIRHPLLRYDEDDDEGGQEEQEGRLQEAEAEAQYHALFRLLQVFFGSSGLGLGDVEEDEDEDEEARERERQATAIASLRPRGYSTDMLDYRGSYVSLLFLEATAVLSQSQGQGRGDGAGGNAAAIVRQHMVAQLLSQGEWGWAVFVCMQIEDPIVRSYAVRDLVLRFGGSRDGGDCDSGSEEGMVVQLAHLQAQCQVPEALLLEAEAYRHCSRRNTAAEANALHTCGLWREAAPLICGGIAPRALFASSSSAALVQSLLQEIEDRHQLEGKEIDAWNLEGGSLLSFFDLKERALAMAAEGCRDIDAIAELVQDAGCLLEQLTDNAFGLFKNRSYVSVSDSEHEHGGGGGHSSSSSSSSLAQVVVDDMGTFLFKTIIRYWACDSSLVPEGRLRGHLHAAPILDDYRCEVLRLFPALLLQ